MDIDTELRVIAELRALARSYGWPGGGMERVDELLDQRASMPAETRQFGPSGGP
ncbi:MAG: hypothetical protein PGN30_10060 [Mycolicibacterium neoaurum]|uniref:hypothetical protein n=1 Tax=Mycolicibacterium neoaurum TaxID=1795 RepID=UPI002FF55034